jgi:hypothetical protein
MANYTVTVAMEQVTVDKLFDSGFYLYGFKAVKAAGSGAPLVWFKSQDFSMMTTVQWEVLYQAYTSKTQIIPNGNINAAANYGIDLNQTLNVTSGAGTGAVDTTTGVDGAISILNKTTTQLRCGISQQQASGEYTPMCAFELFGNNLDVIAPIEKLFLMFSTTPVNTGTVVMQAYSQGILIDLTGAPSNERMVSYDLNQGWQWEGGANWARTYPATANLVPILIQSSASLEDKRLTRLASIPSVGEEPGDSGRDHEAAHG